MSQLTSFHGDIKTILEQARGKARSAVNIMMVRILYTMCRELIKCYLRFKHNQLSGTIKHFLVVQMLKNSIKRWRICHG